jgi:myo-inositol-1(or 4)-monophosphatase
MLEKIIGVVRQAGEMIRDVHNVTENITEKSSHIDVVTQYDTAVQEFLHRELLRLMPEAGFLGEEGAHEEITTEWTFIVDPIDGTANFVRNFGHSNISVALARNGVTEYGVVYNPYRGELYAAQRGKGATLNGKPICVSDSDAAHHILPHSAS